MRTTILLFLVSCCLSSCAQAIRGNEKITTENRALPAFSSLVADGAFDIIIQKGDPQIEIRTDENLHEHIVAEVKDGELRLHTGDKELKSSELVVTISTNALSGVTLSGANDLQSNETYDGDGFHLVISGSSEAALSLNVKSLETDITGSAELSLSGSAQHLEIDVSGAGEINAEKMNCTDADIAISGAADITIGPCDRLEVDISGAGEVKYHGSPQISKSISGAGLLTQIQ